MNKAPFKIALLVLCYVAIYAQQAEQQPQYQEVPQQAPQQQQEVLPQQPPQHIVQPQQVPQPQYQEVPQQQIISPPPVQPQQVAQPQAPLQLSRKSIGVRTSGGLVGVSGISDKYWKEVKPGYSFGMGLFWMKELDIAVVDFGFGLIYKKIASYKSDKGGTSELLPDDPNYKPSTKVKINATEVALEIPLLLKFNISQLFFEVGPQFNLAITTAEKYVINDDKKSDTYSDRNILDCGMAAAVGFNISKQISIDARYFNGLISSFDDKREGSLYQATFSVNLLFI